MAVAVRNEPAIAVSLGEIVHQLHVSTDIIHWCISLGRAGRS